MTDTSHDDEQREQSEESGPEEELTCAVCGHPIAQDDVVCPNCGVSLDAG